MVGYTEQAFEGYRIVPVQFKAVGGGDEAFGINDVLDMSLVQDYADEIQIYDAETGDYTTYIWDTENWIDSGTDEPIDISAVPGSAFMATAAGWRFAGEVPSLTTFDIAVTPDIYTLIGGALPIEATLANFDWTALADYADEIQIYDAETGDYTTYIWDTVNLIDSGTDEPLSFDTPMNNGFMILTSLESITESITPYFGE